MKKTAKKKYPAVFLDRDGVVTYDVHHMKHVCELRLLPNAGAAIKKMWEKGYRVILITNQGAIAKGITTKRAVDEIHTELVKRLKKTGAVLDGIYYCPHHPEGSIKRFAIDCACRKPKPGMIIRAARELSIDLKRSVMIGDKTGDILAGKRADLKTILVKTGYGGSDKIYNVKPNVKTKNILSATRFL